MSDRIVVALDAMGGDQAPAMVIKGAAVALERTPQLEFLLFGVEGRIRPILETLPQLARHCQIRHTDEFITGDAKPSVALRSGRNSSMRLMLDAVAAGEADCAVSAGNTGALMAMAKFALKTLPGIDRPAMCVVFPDEARRKRDARSRRQCRVRRGKSGAVRADGRGLRPYRARPVAAQRRVARTSAPRI